MSFPLGRTARLAVMASGRGSNMAALLSAYPPHARAMTDGNAGTDGHARTDGNATTDARAATNDVNAREETDPLAETVLVLSDKEAAQALARAREAGVTAVHVPWSGRSAFEDETTARLIEARVDLVCLAGFMRLLSSEFVGRWEGRIVNIHPSLLPKHRGLRPYRQALDEGVAESGCSVHFVDAGMDTGKVVMQRRVPVLPDDTEETLGARILSEEHALYPEAVRRVLSGEVKP